MIKYNPRKKYWVTKSIWNNGKKFINIYPKKKRVWWKKPKKTVWFKKMWQSKRWDIWRVVLTFKKNPNFFKYIKCFNIIRKSRNIFTNISTLKGRVLTTSSCGIFKKGSDRRSYLAFQELLEAVSPHTHIKKEFKKSRYVIRIRARNVIRGGFKRNLRFYFKEARGLKVYKHLGIKFKAHNGVRKRKKKRK